MAVVLLLLGDDIGDVEIDEGRGVDVDVVEAGIDRLGGKRAHRVDFRDGILRVVFCVGLEVVALDEDRALPAHGDRGAEDGGGVFGGALLGIPHLGAGNFEEDDLGVVGAGGAEDRLRGFAGEAAQVDGRGGRVGVGALAGGNVERVDRGRIGADGRSDDAHQPARGGLQRAVAEVRGRDEPPDEVCAQARWVEDLDASRGDADDAGERLRQVGGVGERGTSQAGHGRASDDAGTGRRPGWLAAMSSPLV